MTERPVRAATRAELDARMPRRIKGHDPHPCIAIAMLKAWNADTPPSVGLAELAEKYASLVWEALLDAGVVEQDRAARLAAEPGPAHPPSSKAG